MDDCAVYVCIRAGAATVRDGTVRRCGTVTVPERANFDAFRTRKDVKFENAMSFMGISLLKLLRGGFTAAADCPQCASHNHAVAVLSEKLSD